MLKNFFDQQYQMRFFEMNEFGVASPTTMLTLLEETAAEHCFSIDHSLYQLQKENIGWVLISGFMKMERYPSYQEKITIRTWLSNYSTIKGIRENIIYDEQENIIGRAKGLWIFFDILKRKPVEIIESIKQKWQHCPVESLENNINKKIHPLIESDFEKKFKVNRYDTDMIKHVNNIRYLQWVVESVPEDIFENYYLHNIDGRFISEAHLGQTIVSLTKIDEQSDKMISFHHTIKIKNVDRACATAKTVWKRK